MPQKLSRRRFATVIRYLNNLISDEQQPHRIRLRAAERLLDLHERFDRAEARRTKAGANATPDNGRTQGEAVEPQEELLERGQDEAIRAAFVEAMQPVRRVNV